MYFDEGPKTSRAEMFDYSSEWEKLRTSIEGGRRMIIIKGRRRTGKTSLLLSCLNELEKPYMIIDGRVFASSTQVRREEFVKTLEKALNEFLNREKRLRKKVLDALKRVQGIEPSVGPGNIGIGLKWGPKQQDMVNISAIFDALSDEAQKQKTKFIIAFDEAQEFRKIMQYDLTSVIAHAYDYCKGLQFIITGSEMGMLYRFLKVDDSKAPLYGRAMIEIKLEGLNQERSLEYLKKGFRQIKMKVSEDTLQDIHERFDGIIGWLTFVGFKAREVKKIDEKILDETTKKSCAIVADEFGNFSKLYGSDRYVTIMKHLARERKSSWSKIKENLEAKAGVSISNSNVTKLLSTLEDAGFIAKDDEENYLIPDPMITEAVKIGVIK
ncbi:MAG: ATP-binding protein [Nitrosotalea sp.]